MLPINWHLTMQCSYALWNWPMIHFRNTTPWLPQDITTCMTSADVQHWTPLLHVSSWSCTSLANCSAVPGTNRHKRMHVRTRAGANTFCGFLLQCMAQATTANFRSLQLLPIYTRKEHPWLKSVRKAQLLQISILITAFHCVVEKQITPWRKTPARPQQ